MPRPFVHIKATNRLSTYRQHLEAHLPDFRVLDGVVGITLNGGMSRGYADQLSEIDVTIYLEAPTYADWQSGNAPLPLGICIIDGMLYDIKVVDIEAERTRTWEDDALWDASYAEILHDPAGRVAQLLERKLRQFPTPEMAGGFLFQCWWTFRLATDIWLLREDALQGHQMLNQAVVDLTKAVFLANREFVPHEKWLIHLSRSLQWTPDDWPDRLANAMRTGDLSLASLRQRQRVIETLWDEVDVFARRDFPALPVRVMQKSVYDLLLMLAEKERVAIATWQSVSTLDALNRAPFFGIARVEGEWIVLDRAKLLALDPGAMYVWHYEVVQAVIARAAQT